MVDTDTAWHAVPNLFSLICKFQTNFRVMYLLPVRITISATLRVFYFLHYHSLFSTRIFWAKEAHFIITIVCSLFHADSQADSCHLSVHRRDSDDENNFSGDHQGV